MIFKDLLGFRAVVLILALVLSVTAKGEEGEEAAESVEPAPVNCEALLDDADTSKVDPKLLESAEKFKAYFQAQQDALLERDAVVDLVADALLARRHLILVGPPGNAKSMIANRTLGNILDQPDPEQPGTPSYWTHQMTPETTISDTHGPISWNTLNDQDKYRRLLEEGLLMSRTAFIDEYFDGNPKTQRNILQAINERTFSQGTEVAEGKLETTIVASNKYLADVYAKAEALRDADAPKALLDRFAFVFFVPKDFVELQSDISLIQGIEQKPNFPDLTYQDLDRLRDLVPEVKIPTHVASFISLLSDRVSQTLDALEQKALIDYEEAKRNGETNVMPPYRSTKYHSKRTLGGAGHILRTIVVRNWIESGGQRSLSATLEDVADLEKYFAMGGPEDEHLDDFAARTTKLTERGQYDTLMRERRTYQSNYRELFNGVQEYTYRYALTEIKDTIAKKDNPEEREAYARELAEMVIELLPMTQTNIRPWQNTPERIGAQMILHFLTESIKELLGEEQYETVVAEQMRAIEERLKSKAAEEQAEQQRVAAEERERQQQEERRAAQAQALMNRYAVTSDSGNLLISTNHNNVNHGGGEFVTLAQYRTDSEGQYLFGRDPASMTGGAFTGFYKAPGDSSVTEVPFQDADSIYANALNKNQIFEVAPGVWAILNQNQLEVFDANSDGAKMASEVVARVNQDYPAFFDQKTSTLWLLKIEHNELSMISYDFSDPTNPKKGEATALKGSAKASRNFDAEELSDELVELVADGGYSHLALQFHHGSAGDGKVWLTSTNSAAWALQIDLKSKEYRVAVAHSWRDDKFVKNNLQEGEGSLTDGMATHDPSTGRTFFFVTAEDGKVVFSELKSDGIHDITRIPGEYASSDTKIRALSEPGLFLLVTDSGYHLLDTVTRKINQLQAPLSDNGSVQVLDVISVTRNSMIISYSQDGDRFVVSEFPLTPIAEMELPGAEMEEPVTEGASEE